MAQVFLAHAPDGQDMVEEIGKLLENEPAELVRDFKAEPGVWEQAVALFLLTPGLLRNADLGQRAQRWANIGIPVVPVVQDLREYNFASLPQSHHVLGERNAVGLQPDSGQAVVQTVRGYLGLESFAKDKKVFVSYRRKDALQVAREINRYLWEHYFPTYLDEWQLEGGAKVQESILEALSKYDFVLLLDSPDAANSEWVKLEITYSLSQRIPMAVVCVDPNQRHVNLLQEAPHVNWAPSDANNLVRILRLVSRGIARNVSLDHRMQRVLSWSGRLKKLKLKEVQPRRYLLRKDKRRLFVEYEHFPITLERLHRLFLGCRQHRCRDGLYVCGDLKLEKATREALTWARGKAALDVVSVSDFYSFLGRFFP